MGKFVDDLGSRTALGRWVYFVTPTYRTNRFPWAKGFPIEQPQPDPVFVHRFFDFMIRWLEHDLRERVEYFTADQYGEVGGRLHQHFGLSSPSLPSYSWRPYQAMLWERAGWNRILPWEMDAGYYIGRYVGSDAGRCHWDFHVGPKLVQSPVPVGRTVVAVSPAPDETSQEYRRTLGKWHR